MFCNFLTSDRRQTVKRLEELAGKRAEYTRVPRMAFIVEGIAVERDGTVTTEEGASMELIDKLIAEELIQGEAPEATAETAEAAEAAEGEELSEADEAPAETEEADEREELAEGEDATEDEPSASDEPPETEEASEIEGVQAMEIEGPEEEAPTATCYRRGFP